VKGNVMLQSEFDLYAIVTMKPVQAAPIRDELEHGERARALLHRAGSGVARRQRRREFRRIARDFRGPMIEYTSFHFSMLAQQRQWSLALPFLLRSYVVRFYCQLLIVLPFFVHWLGLDARRLAVFLDARMGVWYRRMDSLEPTALSRLRSVSKTEWLALAFALLSAILWWVSIEMPDQDAMSHLHSQ
jgi:hypothetical protein